ncbi:hypothetical protein [Pseudoalteromonas sp. H71]|uniref:hypothetical protein n=1 Tax=Pseudoalteromonas sp. H71 TaxID=1348395 RepID=UPI00073093C5|nr:hypothetical protein [Pseudoalteromonas sp. H71]KTD91643.1 hypothetical protein ATS71_18290 [Pseudoalteromonas sp. H71]
MQQNSDLIHFSRAGDIFHYRWAVKRCLKLLDFNTDLVQVTIEGSLESKLAGECVVDLAEYRKSGAGQTSIDYFQLKHSTVRVDEPFTPSKLKDTLKGFAERYQAIEASVKNKPVVSFTILTNRKISDNFKRNIRKIASGGNAPPGFTQNLKGYTKLDDKSLKSFCKSLNLNDSEGNYESQKLDIHKELHHLAVSKNVSSREKLLVAKVWEKIEPGNSKVIKQEDMLEAFDAISMDDFFPAPPLFEPIENYIPRDQQVRIVNAIKGAKTHTVITASGGVGKSILSSNLATEFETSSVVIPYDCFGNGSYRRVSSQRHEVKHAYAQIINTMATLGLCDQVIPSRNEPDDYWTKLFLNRINEACNSLKSQDSNALLVLIFDAADNAEMAAEEHGSNCFVNQLLKEVVPDNCRLVFTCRPERLDLLDPPSSIQQLELLAFSNEEALTNLQVKYPSATKEQAIEFNRLTGGNPRVQSNALSLKEKSLERLLLSFSYQVVTVEDLIERQLKHSVTKIKDSFPKNYRDSVDNVCTGLAVLPPFVPIDILAAVADVSTDAVKSFISDLGHPLWQIDETVQFRDEPTEKWFQDNYIPTPEKIAAFIEVIKPLVSKFPYVSEALPVLFLKANKLDELVELALSVEYLPSISEYDDNQVKVKRLQYAFKAALKADKTYEAVKLALMAGEEIAGNNRQLDILKNNIDIAYLFLAPARIQEIAHRKEISGGWDGSETVFSASLLSTIPSLKGEAQSYLRSANHWLRRYFDRRDEVKNKEEQFNEKLDDLEILELAHTALRVKGYKRCADYLDSWTPPRCVYKATSSLVERLVDIGDFETIELMANYRKNNPAFVLAITYELMKVGRIPPKNCLLRCLNKIIKPNSRLDKPGDDIHDVGFSNDAYLSFFEACVLSKLPLVNIRRGVNYYYKVPMLYRVEEAHQWRGARENFLRYLSLQAIFKNEFSLDFEEFIPKDWQSKENDYERKRELGRAKELISKLIPWYMVRAKLLAGRKLDLKAEHERASLESSKTGYSAYREYEPVPFETTKAKFQNIMHCDFGYEEELELFLTEYTDNNLKVKFLDNLYFLRVACRTNKFKLLSNSIEDGCYDSISNYNYDESPESRSENFINLSRAVLSAGREDAEAYFDIALNKASGFGEEGVIRWEALTSIAKQYSKVKSDSPELAHRYMRCAEMIGDSVAREKYWDRNDAIKTCFQLSPLSAFPILHRWKDRSIGWHEKLINPLVHSAVDSGDVSAATAWSMSAFSWEFGMDDLLEKALNAEPTKEKRQQMLDCYTGSLRARGVTGAAWGKVVSLAEKYQLSCLFNDELKLLLKSNRPEERRSPVNERETKDQDNYSWEELFGHFDLLTINGFSKAYQKLKKQGFPRRINEFWQGCFQKVTQRSLVTFLNVIAQSEHLNFSSLSWGFEQIPDEWKNKPAVIRQWNSIITQIATRFPRNFTDIYDRRYSVKRFLLDEHTDAAIARGVVAGLSNSVDIESSSALFSFADFSANKLTIEQAKDLLSFGLNRLEQFIEEDYADGSWDGTYQLPTNLDQAIVYYIYANLGSPHSEERWRAVHAVVRLYELREQAAIDNLIDCLKSGLPTSYIPTKYEFYDLHAKLYLLVALTRCVHISPDLLATHANLIVTIATNKQQGVLFQYYAKQVCLEIQNYNSSCIDR